MADLGHFSVQPVSEGGYDGCRPIDAMEPIHAAELILGEQLSASAEAGKARARVWELADNFTPVSITLYGAPLGEVTRMA